MYAGDAVEIAHLQRFGGHPSVLFDVDEQCIALLVHQVNLKAVGEFLAPGGCAFNDDQSAQEPLVLDGLLQRSRRGLGIGCIGFEHLDIVGIGRGDNLERVAVDFDRSHR